MSSTPTTPSTDSAPPAGRPATYQTIGYYAAFTALGLTTASLGPTLPGLASQTHASIGQISVLFTARSLGHLLGSALGGRWYDRLPGQPVMIAMLCAMASALALVPLIGRLWLLALVMLVLGVAEGALDVGGNTLLVWAAHRQRIGPLMNGLHFFFGVGAFLSPVIVAQAVLRGGALTWAYWALSFSLLPAIFWNRRLPSPVAPVAPVGQTTTPVNYWLLALFASFFFFYVGAEASFSGWILTYALASGLSGETIAAYLNAAFWGAFTAGRLLAIFLSTRVQPRALLLGDLMGCVGSAGLILLLPNSLIALWLGTVGTGFFMASVFPTMLALAASRLSLSGRVTAWFLVGASAGAMSLPWLIGQLFASMGPRVTMLIIIAELLASLLIYAALMSAVTRTVLSSENARA